MKRDVATKERNFMMRNSEIVTLVEAVNDVLQLGSVTDDNLALLSKWAQMGIDESGSTAYRVVKILTDELADSRADLGRLSLVQAVEAKQADAVSAGIADDEARQLDDKGDDDDLVVPTNARPDDYAQVAANRGW